MVKRSRFSTSALILLTLFNFALNGLDTHIPVDMDYDFELVKFYLEKEEYQIALNKTDQMISDDFHNDLLHYFRGEANLGLKNWEAAADDFSKVFQNSTDEELLLATLTKFKSTLNQLNAFISIEKISSVLNEVENEQIRTALLFQLADIYENNQLFDEANDVYKLILKDSIQIDNTVDLKLKIVANDIFLKNYQEAIDYLKPILAQQDSTYDKKALFFNYIAQYSMNNYQEAKTSLLKLFLDYPEHLNRFEIIRGLADLYFLERQYLMSWYFLNLLYQISESHQKFDIYNDIEELKQLIAKDSLTIDQFKYLQPVFEFSDKD